MLSVTRWRLDQRARKRNGVDGAGGGERRIQAAQQVGYEQRRLAHTALDLWPGATIAAHNALSDGWAWA